MILEFKPGDKVVNPMNKAWGIGQVQSNIKNKITVNFENVGKKVINSNNILLRKLEKNEVCLFMKGTPETPQCGFSLAVSNVLKHLKVNFKGINILEDADIREGIKEFSDWPTIPQLYIKGEFIGGCDIVKEMFEQGDLQKKLEEKKISFKKN